MTFYIVDPLARHFNVWNHRLGDFATDIDGVYSPSEFGYSDRKYAQKRADRLMQTLGHLPHLEVMNETEFLDWRQG